MYASHISPGPLYERNIRRIPMSRRKMTPAFASGGRRRQRRPKRQTKNAKEQLEEFMDVKIPRSLQASSPFPGDMVRKLTFHQVGVRQGAAPYIIYELRVNGAYRPDNALSPPGFAELAQIYGLYRVLNTRVRFNVVSNEPSIPVFFGLIFRDIQPSTVLTTYQLAVESLSIAPTSGPYCVGETQGTSNYRSRWYKIPPASVVANPLTYYGSTTFEGSVSANPTDLIWCAVVFYSPSNAINLSNGAFVDFYLEMSTRFYSLILQ